MISRSTILLALFLSASLAVSRADDPTHAASATTAVPLESTTAPASTAAPAPPTATDAALSSAPRPTTYTVVNGDTLWDLSHKFNCSIRSLKKLNNLKKNNLKPGQILKIPPVHATKAKPTASSQPGSSVKKTKIAKVNSPATSTLTANKIKARHHSSKLVAQPVQDFDIPASTFASCPTPPSNDSDSVPSSSSETAIRQPVAPSSTAPTTVSTEVSNPPSLIVNNRRSLLPVPTSPTPVAPSTSTAVSTPIPPAKKSFVSAISDFFGGSHASTSESGEWGNRFLSETRSLAVHGIGYDQSWRPEGESHAWAMDCSNTSRYLYQVTAGIQLPRTASDQYYYLHLQNKAWDVPTVANGFADCNFLRSNLKPGDLLFWENTYRPDRQPPITHVMIFLGTNARGQWIMAGSQSSHGGQFNPHRSGPDVYVFDPTHAVGGYSTWMGLVHHQGRFCAYGRPLEADVKKLSVAAND